jgi:hypothetical protein
MRKFKLWDKLEIDWMDSVSNTSGWKTPEEFNWKNHYNALYHKAIGYYVNECKDGITICQSYAVDNGGMFTEAFTVPRGCIQKIKKLK